MWQGLRVKAGFAGRRVRCPNKACGQPINVPDVTDEQDDPVASRVLWPWLAGGGVLVLLLAGLGIWALTRHRSVPPSAPAGNSPIAVAPAKPVPPVESHGNPEPATKEPVKPRELPAPLAIAWPT